MTLHSTWFPNQIHPGEWIQWHFNTKGTVNNTKCTIYYYSGDNALLPADIYLIDGCLLMFCTFLIARISKTATLVGQQIPW
jgi:hypothetical protein